jgi:hypothetical protein
LTLSEARVFDTLMQVPSPTYDQIMDGLYAHKHGGFIEPGPDIVKVYVCMIRRKLRRLQTGIDILTEYGTGYRMPPASKKIVRQMMEAEIEDEKADLDQAERGGGDVPGAAGVHRAAGAGAGKRQAG